MLGLSPIPWEEGVRLTNNNAPYIGEILEAMLREAQAVIVLLTDDDEARLIKSEFLIEDEDDKEYSSSLYYRPRPNVVFEAGMALSNWHANRTILVEVGKIRIYRPMAGRHRIKLSNHMKHRWRLIQCLQDAGCAVKISSNELVRDIGNFDFEW